MKRFLCILLCAVMMMSLLAGCGGGQDDTQSTAHQHTYASEWSYDKESHWYQATCEHSTLQANAGEHIDDDLDGICDICKYAFVECTHTYSDVWSSNETSHWHAATCNHIGSVSDKADHADTDNDGACDVCGYMGEHKHTFSEAWTTDGTQHWHEATCGHDVVDAREDHTDQSNDGVCDVCALDYSGCDHTFSDAWTTDVTYHWHAATCQHLGAISGQAQHADADEDGRCDVCDYLMCKHQDYDLNGECDICGWFDPEHTHEFGTEIGSDVTGHWYVATCHPGATSKVEDHKDEDNNGVCDVCQFQICGHSYADVWSCDDTHHWHAILCTCSIARKDYETHVDADNDGGCDICMYGLPVEAVYEMLLEDEPFTLVENKMITYAPVVINFPRAGRYVITPSNEEVSVWMTDGSDYGQEDAFFNSGSSLTLEVTQPGEMTLWFQLFDFDYKEGKEIFFTYTVIRIDDLVIETMQGKVELPANTLYTVKFIASEMGTYKLITGVPGIVIGLTEDSMEFFKGHVELNVTSVGQEFTFYIRYDDASVHSFVFDWRLEPPFCLEVGEGNYAVDVAPGRIDYKVEFTAPEAGYYQLKVASKWLTFCRWGHEYGEPVRLETMEILTPYLAKGDVFTTWLETVYDYPAATNCYDTLTVTNVGQLLTNRDLIAEQDISNDGTTVNGLTFIAQQSGIYRFTASNIQAESYYYDLVIDDIGVRISDKIYEFELMAGQKIEVHPAENFSAHMKVELQTNRDLIAEQDISNDGTTVNSLTFMAQQSGIYCFTASNIQAESYYYDLVINGIGVRISDKIYEFELMAGQEIEVRPAENFSAHMKVELVHFSVFDGTVKPGADGGRYCFQATEDSYYRIEFTGGELGVIAPTGSVTWTSDAYEVQLKAGQTYSFMLRGSGNMSVKIAAVDYSVDLVNGANTVTLEPNRHYNIHFLYRGEGSSEVVDMDFNSVVSLSWEGNLYVYVNGEAYTQGARMELMNNQITVLVKSNGAAEVKIKVTVLEDANNRPVGGVSEAEMVLNQTVIMAVNRDGDGAKATFTAEVGGTYTLTTYDANAVIYVVSADGSHTQVLVGQGDYSFNLDAGETIEFFIDTVDQSAASVSLVVSAGR